MDGQPELYVSEEKIHAREVNGLFEQLRRASTALLLGIYYVLPWITWDDRQAVLFDLPARRFYIFGLTFWPQDFIYMAWLLIIAGVGLFLLRHWQDDSGAAMPARKPFGPMPLSGWSASPRGNRSRRIKLDKAPWTGEKILRKGSKQFLWITFSLWTGFIFVGYFTPVRELAPSVVNFNTGGWEAFWIVFYSFATYGNAGIMREQVCKYMCPYARFQSSMFDHDSLIVSYDTNRGEPRGSRSRKNGNANNQLGDCIDCTLCVQVCPTGIDIRDGLQYECIACAACVDACDSVMDKMGYARGLVRYTTENALAGKKSRILRPRTAIYGVLMIILLVGITVALSNRHELGLDVIRDRNALYRELADGNVENVYTLKLTNKSERDHLLRLTVSGLPGLVVDDATRRFTAKAGELTTIAVRVHADPDEAPGGGHPISFTIESENAPEIAAQSKSRFFLPLE